MSPRTQSARDRPTDRRGTILAAAAQLIRQRGFAQVGIDDIGAAIGLSGPALYRYFDSKHTLLAEIIIDHLDRIAAEQVSRPRVNGRSRSETEPRPVSEPGASAGLIRALVDAAMREPNAMFVTVMYSGLLAGEPLARVRQRRQQFDAEWDCLVPPIGDTDGWSQEELRTRAIAGALTHLSLARTGSRTLRSSLARRIIGDLSSVRLEPLDLTRAPAAASALTHVSRREAILAVAVPLFCDHGYAAVSLSDIGSPLGITGSAVARQFGSKEDLLATAILRGSEQISAGVALALRRSASASEAARAMLASYVSLAVDFPELVVVQNIEPYALSEQFRSERRKRHRVYIDELARVVDLTHPENGQAASRLRAGAAFGAINQAIVGGVRARSTADATNLLRIATTVALTLAPETG